MKTIKRFFALALLLITFRCFAQPVPIPYVTISQRGSDFWFAEREHHLPHPPGISVLAYEITEGVESIRIFQMNDPRNITAYKMVVMPPAGPARIHFPAVGATYSFYYFEVWPAFQWAWVQVDADDVFRDNRGFE